MLYGIYTMLPLLMHCKDKILSLNWIICSESMHICIVCSKLIVIMFLKGLSIVIVILSLA